ncbi:MAG: PHP domain-containing protein, partial [Bacteroidales bacterium]
MKKASVVYKVNSHIHTPYSFSAFNRIEEAFEKACEEDVKILGINDFYTTEGYAEFYGLALEYNIFPLFNVEFIGLSIEHQQKKIRINDPSNPGRIYFCGKGLDYPLTINEDHRKLIEGVVEQNHLHISAMIKKTNQLLEKVQARFRISRDEIFGYTRSLVRERHIAKTIRIKVNECYPLSDDRKKFLEKLYGSKISVAGTGNDAAVENEIRENLLKKGGFAYIEEDAKAFLSVDDIKNLILHAGGIPCYPVLLDNEQGEFTEFENNWEKLRQNLDDWNVESIELIPGRNDFNILKRFIEYFY